MIYITSNNVIMTALLYLLSCALSFTIVFKILDSYFHCIHNMLPNSRARKNCEYRKTNENLSFLRTANSRIIATFVYNS